MLGAPGLTGPGLFRSIGEATGAGDDAPGEADVPGAIAPGVAGAAGVIAPGVVILPGAIAPGVAGAIAPGAPVVEPFVVVPLIRCGCDIIAPIAPMCDPCIFAAVALQTYLPEPLPYIVAPFAKYVLVALIYQTTGPDVLVHFGAIIAWFIIMAGGAATAIVADAVVSAKTAMPLNILRTWFPLVTGVAPAA